MIPSSLFQPLANHLWQSTLFAAVAGLLTLALRKNRAQTRYWLWLTASVKFLIPFSLLVDVGGHFGRHIAPATASPDLSSVIEQVSQPFTAPFLSATIPASPETSPVNWIPAVLYSVWVIGSATLVVSWWLRWRRLRAVLCTASPLGLPIGMEAMTSPVFAEPGVFGVRRPVLLLPAGITDRLTPPQLEAIVAHELCHVRRRDNLATAIHMGVEALFWFHPLVWWLGARLMDERERACDEEVLLRGSDPKAYAERILNTCELYLESCFPCVAGVTGGNLKKRIEEIMANRIGLRLSFAKRIALAAVGAAALTAPIVVGLNTPAIQARSQSAAARPEFEVASIKLNKSVDPIVFFGLIGGGRFSATNIPLQELITMTYRVRDFQLSGAPAWLRSERYDVEARAEAKAGFDDLTAMLQPLLENRLHLKFHPETIELPFYSLTVTKPGKLIEAEGECGPPRSGPHGPPCGFVYAVPGHIAGEKARMSRLVDALSRLTHRVVRDKTGLTGRYDINLDYLPELLGYQRPPTGDAPGAPPVPLMDPNDPALLIALQQKLGLKLESQKGPVEIMVIDHVERPSGK